MQNRYWIGCGLILVISIGLFGSTTVLLVLGGVSLFILGALLRVAQYGYEKTRELESNRISPLVNGHQRGLQFPLGKKLDTIDYELKFTDSPEINSCLQDILNYATHDYIDTWYSTFSSDATFSKSIKQVACETISRLSVRLKQIDWVTFLTRDIADDFASHIRLYRRAKEKCQRENSQLLRQSCSNSSSLDKSDYALGSTGGATSTIDRDLDTYFFDFELEMEKNYCRDSVSTSRSYENAYLHDVATILFYLLLPTSEFNCRPSFLLIREIVVKKFLLSFIDLMSDPDFIYDSIVWLLSDVPVTSEHFLAVIEKCQDSNELAATKEAIEEEIRVQRSKDTGGKDDAEVKQQLSSLLYVHRLIISVSKRLKGDRLSEQENTILRNTASPPHDIQFFDLPLEFILENSIAINYFMDFLSKNEGGAYIGLYLNLSSFNSAATQHESSKVQDAIGDRAFTENMRETALNIYELYLSGQISDKVKLDKDLIERTLNNVSLNEDIASWFEELQTKLYSILLTDPKFYPAFKKSETYLKLLTEIRIASQLDNEKYVDHETNATFLAEDALDSVSLRSADSSGEGSYSDSCNLNVKVDSVECQAEYTANIDTVALGNEGFALYNITANRHNEKGEITATWNVVRRYSDFYSLHNFVQQKFPALRILSFPGKKAFNNLCRDLWEKRKKSLNNYLKILLLPATLQQNKGLEVALMDFLCSKEYSSDKSTIANRISSFVFDPIKFGVKSFGNAVISMPDRVVDNVVRVGDNLGKVTKSVFGVMSFESGGAFDENEISPSLEGRVGAQLDAAESSSNIPIRILLLCMDEVFGLRKRNQWFRRRLVAFLHHFIHAAFGSSINRKIIDYVNWLTSKEQVAEYLTAFRNKFWPNGTLCESTQPKPESLRMKTRVVARCKMLAVIPDELQLFMGSDTTLDGVTLVFDALKNPRLNRRLCYVIIERILLTLFPDNKFEEILPKLHSKSPRCNGRNSTGTAK